MTEPSSRLSHPGYRADIDGLRALAVLAVVTFHAFPSWLAGGFIGVDIFFVISGYLISTIIYENLERGTFSFLEFYARRIRRIFPALIVVLLACFAYGWLELLANEFKLLGKHIAGGAAFVSNWVLLREADYFDVSTDTKPLLHLWSLGIEEQFYIVWPLLLWCAFKQRINLLAVGLFVTAISYFLNVTQVNTSITADFYTPQTRVWELMFGSMLAWLAIHQPNFSTAGLTRVNRFLAILVFRDERTADGKKLASALSLLAMLLLAFGFWLIDKDVGYPGNWALIPVLGAVLLIFAGPGAWVNRIVLSNRLAVWFGLISFPLYLWHWPLLSFARILAGAVPGAGIRGMAIAASIVLAWLTYRFVERPLRGGEWGQRKAVLLALLMALIACAGYYTYGSNGFPFRNKKMEQYFLDLEYEKSFHSNQLGKNSYADFQGYYAFKSRDAAPTVLLLGDSFANRMIMGLSTLDNSNVFLHLSNHACPEFLDLATPDVRGSPLADKCVEYTDYAMHVAETSASIHTVIFYARGPLYVSPIADRRLSLKNYSGSGDASTLMEIAIRRTFDKLMKLGKKIIFVYSNPEIPFDPASCLDSRALRASSIAPADCHVKRELFERYESAYRSLMAKVLKDYPKIKVLDAADIFCDQAKCLAMKDNTMLYSDRNHLSLAGSVLLANAVLPLLQGRSATPGP